MNIGRVQKLSGVLGVALLGLALALPGQPPRASDSAKAIRAALVHHRGAFVGGMVLAGLGFTAFIWFVATVAAEVQRDESSGRPTTSPVVLATGLAAAVLVLVGMVASSGVAFRAAGGGDLFVVRASVDTGNMLIELSKFAFAAFIAAFCLGVSRARVSSWLVGTGWVASALLGVSAVPPFLTDRGAGQFNGPLDLGGTVPAFLWLAVLSVVLARAGRRHRSAVTTSVAA